MPLFILSFLIVVVLLCIVINYRVQNNNNNINIVPSTEVSTLSSTETISTAPQIQSRSVYVTKYGDKYHKCNCYYIQNSSTISKLPVETAISQGYKPCKICNP